MAHTKNNSFGYTSTLLRLFHQTDIYIDEDTILTVYPHEDIPNSSVVGLFDLRISRDGVVHREYANLTYPDLIRKIEAYYDIA
jgi:hypothetical protein